MRKFKILTGRTMAVALSAAMMFQGTALAGPLDELNEIIEKQMEDAGDNLLEQTIGFSDLAEQPEFSDDGETSPGDIGAVGFDR